MQVNTDGGARGNPGPAAIGIVFWKNGQMLKQHSEFIGRATNNEAEYFGLIRALELAEQGAELEISMDSELVVRQMKGIYRVRLPRLQELYSRAKRLEPRFRAVRYRHVRRDDPCQAEADRLVNIELEKRGFAKSVRGR